MKEMDSIYRYVVMSGKDNTLDSICSVVAYAEYLFKKKFNTIYYIDNNSLKKIKTILDMVNLKLNSDEYKYKEKDKFILINHSNSVKLPIFFDEPYDIITNKNIKERDNRTCSIASVIAYYFYENKISISKESAILLYYAILDKTINFKSKNSKEKDIKMASWLQSQFPDLIIDNIYENIFKIANIEENINYELNFNMIIIENKGSKVGIIKINSINVKSIIEDEIYKIQFLLKQHKNKHKLQSIILLFNDLKYGKTSIIEENDESNKLIEEIFNFDFNNNNFIEYTRIISRGELSSRIFKESKLTKKINKLFQEKSAFLGNTYFWVKLCIDIMKNVNVESLSKHSFSLPNSKNVIKNIKIKKCKIEKILSSAINEDLYYSSFTYLVASVEDYFTKIIKIILEKDNKRILTIVKDINFKNQYELLDIINPKNSLVSKVIEDRVTSVLYANPKNQIEYFRKALNIEIEDWNYWFEIKATRDIIVHNFGIINGLYISKSGEYKRGDIGEKIVVDEEYFKKTITYLKKSMRSINEQVKKNFDEI